MIEPIMFFGIGFLVASLLGLVLIPLVHNRAVRLTMRRLEAATPLSMAEIQADKDQLRAEFAMSTRRLELSVEQMKSRTTSQLAELGKKTDSINRLKVELGEKTAAIFSLEAREKSLKDQLHATESEHSVKIGALREAERMLSDKQAELARISADLGERSATADSQRVETTALRVQVEALKERVNDHEREAHEIGDRLNRERQAAGAATTELNEARSRVEKLSDRVMELERALVAQTTEAEVLGRRVQELEVRMVDQAKTLSDREQEISRLNEALVSGHKTEIDLRAELTNAASRGRAASEGLIKEKALIEDQLAQSKADRSKLQQEIAAMKREAEQTWAAERVENALLRERINDIAAEIARLTVALEGADSPIEAMLAGEPATTNGQRPTNGEHKTATTGGESKGNLADRIRALQLKASRVPVTN
jgi:chromosome segregation ATPase